tara:strand:+ start:302 stop:604 length:303 start_codon:yes stop_codon:yes gene_type:complete
MDLCLLKTVYRSKHVQHTQKSNIIKTPLTKENIMACGDFAEPIYKLITDLGDSEEARQLVLDNLIKYLSGEEIERFVESFRRDYDLDESIIQTHFDPNAE